MCSQHNHARQSFNFYRKINAEADTYSNLTNEFSARHVEILCEIFEVVRLKTPDNEGSFEERIILTDVLDLFKITNNIMREDELSTK